MRHWIKWAFWCMLLGSCDPQDATSRMIPDHPHLVPGASSTTTHRIGPLEFTCSVMPALVVDNNLSEITIHYALALPEQRADLLKENSGSLSGYEERLKYCAFGIANDFMISDGAGNHYPCLFAHYERSYGMDGRLLFQLGFQVRQDAQDLTLTYNDRLFDRGPVKHRIALKDLDESMKIVP